MNRSIHLLAIVLVSVSGCAPSQRPPITSPAIAQPSDANVDAPTQQESGPLARLREKLVEKLSNDRLAFVTSLGPDGQLALYDQENDDVWFYPGAGTGSMANAYEFAPNQFTYELDNVIYAYDAEQELRIQLFDPRAVGGFAFYPLPDVRGNMYCLGTDDPAQALLGRGQLYKFNGALPNQLHAMREKLVARVGSTVQRLGDLRGLLASSTEAGVLRGGRDRRQARLHDR